ncbi:hypothetical protein Vafri_11999 [Volvox africanus]|uniref:Uncharacterized protein n=1 Tax=Volvox africanus TaxID=51714 RepID=A0A8J4BDL7_9CHLO|nr:hypothetical protein Vafri_11999 [Volvox africanus]
MMRCTAWSYVPDGVFPARSPCVAHNRDVTPCIRQRIGLPGGTFGWPICLGRSVWPQSATTAIASRLRCKVPRRPDPRVGRHGIADLSPTGVALSAKYVFADLTNSRSIRRRVLSTVASASGSPSGNKNDGGSSNAAGRRDTKTGSQSSGGIAESGDGGSGGRSVEVASAAVAASVAAAAVVGAVASAAPPPPPRATALGLLQRVVTLLRSQFLAVLLLYAIKDGVAFLLHRVTQRMTNHAAEVLLGVPTSSAGNPWWLYLDPAFIRAHPGYELLIGLFFLACLPFTIALNSLVFTTAALICPPKRQLKDAVTLNSVSSSSSPSPPSSSWQSPSLTEPPFSSSSSSLSSSASLLSPRSRSKRIGVGESMYLPSDDPAAAALADLGIHALPTVPPPSGQADGSPVTIATLSSRSSPLFAEPTPSMSTISAATTLAAAPFSLPLEAEAGEADGKGATTPEGNGPWDALRTALASVAAALPEATRAFSRVWWVDLQFNARALPLQGLCLLVLPALWAIPRLMRIQLALPVAVLEARSGRDALNRSSNLMTSSIAAYSWPFAALLAVGRLLEYVQGLALVLIPPRWWREVVEVPLLIAGAFLLLKASVHRLQDLLPLAAYLELTQQEAETAQKLQDEMQPLHPRTDLERKEHHDQEQREQQQQQPREVHARGNSPTQSGNAAALPGAAAGAAT